jgi:excisionase family DNA binding protein
MSNETMSEPVARPPTTESGSRRRRPRARRLAAAAPHGQLLTVEAAAAYLGFSPGTLRNWISVRRIAYVKVGRLTRIAQVTIDRYIAEHTVQAHTDDDESL